MSKKIFVYIDLEEHPILVGKLWTHTRNGHESATFEYAIVLQISLLALSAR